jgi:glycosyltransferase involved in cell wall biosynthesis
MKPLVSIIVPVFNVEEYLDDCINSILNQTYKNIEVILVDDGSTDNSGKICDLLGQKNNKVKVFHNNNNGVSYTRNYAIRMTTGKYILPVDGDDIIADTYVEKAVNILEKNDSIGIVYCRANFFGKINGEWELPDYSIGKMLLNNIIFVTSIFRKEDWETVGGFNEKMKYGIEDYDFWLSIIELNRKVYRIPEILFYYRITNNSRSTKFDSDINKKEEMYNMIYKNHKNLYIKNFDIVIEEFMKERLLHEEKINKIKSLFPFYFIVRNNNKLKNILKKLFKL